MKPPIYRFRLILSIVSLLILIPSFLLLIIRSRSQLDSTRPLPTSTVDSSLTLILNFGDQTPDIYTTAFPASASAFTLLQQTAARENLEFSFKEYPFGNLVTGIAGRPNSPEKSWIYLVNDRSPDIGASDYLLQPGDRVEWKYIKPL